MKFKYLQLVLQSNTKVVLNIIKIYHGNNISELVIDSEIATQL